MRFAYALVLSTSVVLVGCGSGSPLSPDTVSASSRQLSSVTTGSVLRSQSFFPPINPLGISCPSDAPQLRVGSTGGRMDIEFSEVSGAHAYEIQVLIFGSSNVYESIARLEVPAPAYRAEWYGKSGRYQVRIRTINCGGFGNWSNGYDHSLNEDGEAPPTPPVIEPETEPDPEEPHCMVGCF
jgi:hypothetical protein